MGALSSVTKANDVSINGERGAHEPSGAFAPGAHACQMLLS